VCCAGFEAPNRKTEAPNDSRSRQNFQTETINDDAACFEAEELKRSGFEAWNLEVPLGLGDYRPSQRSPFSAIRR
jgi:hypothetical protein